MRAAPSDDQSVMRKLIAEKRALGPRCERVANLPAFASDTGITVTHADRHPRQH
jgi:hypothetical protein